MEPTPPCHPPHRPLLQLGRVVATPAALDALARAGQTADEFFDRHARHDGGDLSDEDKHLNDEAVVHEGELDRQQRVFSVYHTADGTKLYCVTEWDRTVTSLIRADEY